MSRTLKDIAKERSLERKSKNNQCPYCNSKQEKDWEEDGFYGYYSCNSCHVPTAFIISKEHKGSLTDEEKAIVRRLAKKYYPDLKLKGNLEKNMFHWYDILDLP